MSTPVSRSQMFYVVVAFFAILLFGSYRTSQASNVYQTVPNTPTPVPTAVPTSQPSSSGPQSLIEPRNVELASNSETGGTQVVIFTNSRSTIGWWGKDGKLHESPVQAGLAFIPADVLIISIPPEYAGGTTPEGWARVELLSGEWVLIRTKIPASAFDDILKLINSNYHARLTKS